MKRFVFYLVSAGAILLSAQATAAVHFYSDSEVAEMVKNAPSKDQFPQAGGVILLHQRIITYAKDGSSVADEHFVVKLLQERGKDSYGDTKRRYNKELDSVVVVKAVSYLTDGRVMPVEAKAINDLTPSDLANATIYSNIMQKVVNFPGLAPGVSIELKLKIYSKAPEPEEPLFIWGGDLFQSTDPILYKELSLNVPQDFEIGYTYQNEGLDYTTATEGGMTTHTWQIRDAAQIIGEPFMPKLIKVAPRLIYTNSKSWDSIGAWFAGKFYPHVKVDGEMAKKVEELTKGAASREEKIRSICLYVIEDIRGIGEWSLPLGLAGYEPHDADTVLINKYGDWRDKTVLLVSLLKAAGIESYPVFMHREAAKLEAEYPSLKQFNVILVYIPDYQGKPLWVSSFADKSLFGYVLEGQGGTGLCVRPDRCELIPDAETSPDFNQSATKFELGVKPNGDVEGTVACQLGGVFDSRARYELKEATQKEVEQYFLKAANAIGEGSKSKSFKTTDLTNLADSVKVVQSFWTPEMGVVQGGMMILNVPDVPFGFAQLPFYPGQTVRNYDFVFETAIALKKEGVISLPKGYKAVYVAEPMKIENSFGTWQAEFRLNADSTIVEYGSSVTLVDKEIDTEEYGVFKKAFDDFTSPRNNLILLEKR